MTRATFCFFFVEKNPARVFSTLKVPLQDFFYQKFLQVLSSSSSSFFHNSSSSSSFFIHPCPSQGPNYITLEKSLARFLLALKKLSRAILLLFFAKNNFHKSILDVENSVARFFFCKFFCKSFASFSSSSSPSYSSSSASSFSSFFPFFLFLHHSSSLSFLGWTSFVALVKTLDKLLSSLKEAWWNHPSTFLHK